MLRIEGASSAAYRSVQRRCTLLSLLENTALQ